MKAFRITRNGGLSTIALLLAIAPAGADQQVAPAAGSADTAAPVTTDPNEITVNGEKARVVALATMICEELGKVRRARPLDLEASVALTLSQVEEELKIKNAALIDVEARCPMSGLPTALAGARRALNNGRLEGTAGLAGPGFGDSNSFSAPFVDVGGGSVNYSVGG